PKKMKDPTEAALSAIQDALSVPDSPAETEPAPPLPPPVTRLDEPDSEAPWRTVRTGGVPINENLFEEELRRGDDAGAMRRPANDDRESIGQILHTVQRRPGRTPYLVATLFAAIWLLGGLALAAIYRADLMATLAPTGWTVPVLAVLGIILFVPLIYIYMLAHLFWRSQELRFVTQSMAEVAMRLAEPE